MVSTTEHKTVCSPLYVDYNSVPKSYLTVDGRFDVPRTGDPAHTLHYRYRSVQPLTERGPAPPLVTGLQIAHAHQLIALK